MTSDNSHLPAADRFIDQHVRGVVQSYGMIASWNGDNTDFPSWEVSDDTGHLGHVGFTGNHWEVETMLDSISYAEVAVDLPKALLNVQQRGRAYRDVEENLAEWQARARRMEARGDALSQVLGRIGATIGGGGLTSAEIVAGIEAILDGASRDEMGTTEGGAS
jgi:hypothetical protein